MDSKFYLNMGSAGFAFLAAALWLTASLVRKKGKAVPPTVMMGSGDIDNGTLLGGTMRLQGLWNSAAAVAAAIASILQGVGTIMSA